MDLSCFALPTEQLRLLSDRPRNDALLRMLQRRALGARVLEVGCGTGIWSCIAARLGASRVLAVEATSIADLARCVVRDNGLEHIVTVVQARIEELTPEPMDLVFSELLNADPFAEGVVGAMQSAAAWGGRLSPSRLRVYAALTRADDFQHERSDALAELRRVSEQFDLDLGVVQEFVANPGCLKMVTHDARLLGPPVVVWDLALGTSEVPDSPMTVDLPADEDGEAGGVMLWFEADMDAGVAMHNRPGEHSHWGQLVLSWPVLHRVRRAGTVPATFEVYDGEVFLQA